MLRSNFLPAGIIIILDLRHKLPQHSNPQSHLAHHKPLLIHPEAVPFPFHESSTLTTPSISRRLHCPTNPFYSPHTSTRAQPDIRFLVSVIVGRLHLLVGLYLT